MLVWDGDFAHIISAGWGQLRLLVNSAMAGKTDSLPASQVAPT